MPVKPIAPKGYRQWPNYDFLQLPKQERTKAVIELYNSGCAGVLDDPEAKEMLRGSMTDPNGENVLYNNKLVGSGAGMLTLAYIPAWAHWSKMWPCPGQETGDCVSHAGKNSAIVLIGYEIESGIPDPLTGKIETWPEISDLGEREGVVACEPSYGYRGHSGQGASCSRLQYYFTNYGGTHLRVNYPALGVSGVPNLETYQVRLGMNWGGKNPPEAVNEEGKKHQIREATNCSTHEQCRDFLANGYPIWACSGLGWSSSRNEDGYSVQRGGWSHSWIIMAYDDRPDTVREYGSPLALFNHDWGRWNSGGRDIRNTQDMVAALPEALRMRYIAAGVVNSSTGKFMIPEGSMWIKATYLGGRYSSVTAMSSLNGWPRRPINYMFF